MSTSSAAPVFSIIIPTYNRSKVIQRTLASVQMQTFKDFECIIVDDGSDDGEELATVVAAMVDERFRYVRQENGGASSARNRGFDVANGRYIALLDSDDEFLANKLERCNEILNEADSGEVLLYSQMIVERGMEKKWVRPARGPLPSERVDEYILCTPGTIRTSTIVISASLARRIRFDEGLPWFQDSDFAIRASNAGASVKFVREPLVVLEDQVGYSRVSRSGDFETVLKYFDRMRRAEQISERSYWAGRGWPCARVASSTKRPYALLLFFQALAHCAFPWRHAFIVGAQVIMPYRLYQEIANGVVRLRGRRID